ncbi:MAG: glycosyltransferase family 4 protein [Phycisphaeraceae bacterium]|nr:glycosyltransferase family 4 protein [Phycisphaeraceae bacterium]
MEASLRVLHLTAGSDAGGVSRYLSDLATAMLQRGHHSTIAGRKGAWHDLFAQRNIPWIEAPLAGGWLGLSRARTMLLKQIDPDQVDVIHVHYRKSALVGRWLARTWRKPLLFTLHLTGIPMTWPWSRLSDFGDHTHAPSSEARRWLMDAARVPEDRITLIPHGVDAAKFPLSDEQDQTAARQSLGLAPDQIVAAFVGRFDEPKNESWMIDVATASRDAGLPVTVLMQGGGPRESALRRRIRQRGAAEIVKVLPYGDPLPVYRAADVVMLPSSLEGFSLVGLEAMCVGRPVLRTRTAGTSEQIVENRTGRSTPIRLDQFVAAAVDLLGDRAHLQRMGRQAARHVRENLTLARQVDQTTALYRQMIEDDAWMRE